MSSTPHLKPPPFPPRKGHGEVFAPSLFLDGENAFNPRKQRLPSPPSFPTFKAPIPLTSSFPDLGLDLYQLDQSFLSAIRYLGGSLKFERLGLLGIEVTVNGDVRIAEEKRLGGFATLDHTRSAPN
ncbi:BRCA1 C Terminus (BRCT) domain [Musa troglodytarum]|uniref:BRCA1 C Terminus (BRCT) domain n=1 Tax=Musa troglodytarum TaxID=320322 RepID=A0A9E7KQF1_9LILI|nr:BRCA1 C Terminus (BRCT) domain [Musa troglodytarum]